MLDPLQGRENDWVEISDNDEAALFLTRLQIINQFTTRAGFASASWVMFSGHNTHWIVAGRFHGYEKKEDNGYQIFCLPKLGYSLEQAEKFQNKMAESSEKSVKVIDSIREMPRDNLNN